MMEALENNQGSVSIRGRITTNLRFADDIDGLTGTEEELANLVNHLDEASTIHTVEEISVEKTKLMSKTNQPPTNKITVDGLRLMEVSKFKWRYNQRKWIKDKSHLKSSTSTKSNGQTQTHLEDQNISLKTKLMLLCTHHGRLSLRT